MSQLKVARSIAILLALAIGSTLSLGKSHWQIPEPGPHNIGFAGAALDHSRSETRLGSVTEGTHLALTALRDLDQEALFAPGALSAVALPPSDSRIYPTFPRPFALFYSLAFALFGLSFRSVIYLWSLIFVGTVGLAAVALRTHSSVNALIAVVAGVSIQLGTVPLMDHNASSVVNYRLAPLLAVIPAVALGLAIFEGNFRLMPTIILAGLVGFVIAVRPTSIWIIGAVLVTTMFRVAKTRRAEARSISAAVVALGAIGVSAGYFVTMQSRVPDSVEAVEAISDSARWKSVAIGLLRDPRLHQSYACSDEEFVTSLRGVVNKPCTAREWTRIESFKINASPSYRYDDQDAYAAALRYIQEFNLQVDLGRAETRLFGDLSQFNMDWNAYGAISRLSTIRIIRHEPVIALEIMAAKLVRIPIMLAVEMGSSVRAALSGKAPRSALLLWALGICGATATVTLGRLSRRTALENHLTITRSRDILKVVLILLVLSFVPSIIFYPIPHAALDAAALAWGLILCGFTTIDRGTSRVKRRTLKRHKTRPGLSRSLLGAR